MMEKVNVFYYTETRESAIRFVADVFDLPPPTVESIFIHGAFFVGKDIYIQVYDLEELDLDNLLDSEIMIFPLGEKQESIIDIVNCNVLSDRVKIKFYV